MSNKSLQIQAVLYQNPIESLMRSMESIKNAIHVCHRNDGSLLSDVRLCYGDASPTPLLDEETVENIRKQFQHDFCFDYSFFGFNSGSAKGHNILNEKCESHYTLLMNPDIIFCPRFLIELMQPFHQMENVGIVEGRQTPIEHPKDYNRDTGETSWSSGACTLIQTELFHQVGGYDAESFFMYCDDVDLSWRIRLLDKKIIFQPRAVVFHTKRLSKKGDWQPTDAEKYYSMEAALLMLRKWSSQKQYEDLLKTLSTLDDENAVKIARDFTTREKKGVLPNPVKNAHKVAIFVDGNYAPHRFAL